MLIIGLFVAVAFPMKPGIFDLIYGLVALTTITSAFLWLKRKLIFIGLIFYLIGYNIDLIFNPVTIPDQAYQLTSVHWIGTISGVIGIVLLLLGLWNRINTKPCSKLDVKLSVVVLVILVFSGLIQTTIRLV